jgi:hypothetical protein
LFSGGGEARSVQASALWTGIIEAHGVGAGHGVGVPYVRSDQYPWRYELVWVATIFRVGLVGAIVYFLPFAFYIAAAVRSGLHRSLTMEDRFLLGGFLCAFVASGTNPYIESFAFQWMYILPIVWFFRGRKQTAQRSPYGDS